MYFSFSSIKLPKRVSEQIELELGMKSCFPGVDVSDDQRDKQETQDGSELQQRVQLDDSVRDSVRRMVLAQAASSASESYVPGVAQLAALLLETCDKDEELALGVLCRLLSRVSSYFADQQVYPMMQQLFPRAHRPFFSLSLHSI